MPNPVTASLMRRPSCASSGVALSTGERTRPPRGSPHTTSLGRGLSSYPHTKRNRRPARGRAACELPNAFPSIGTRATYRQLRPARYPQTRAVADKKTPPSSKDLVDASFPTTLTRRQRRRDAAVAHHGRRTYCGCTPDAANRVSNMAMAPCDNPAETCANHSLITSYSPPWKIMAHRLEGRDPGRCGWGAHTGRGLVSRADQT